MDNIDEILAVSDGVMVARGDMGVEIAFDRDAPSSRRMIIEQACSQGKLVITATQMLDSMIKNPRPTRAEITDVANAIYDGTSAIMLSGRDCRRQVPCRGGENHGRHRRADGGGHQLLQAGCAACRRSSRLSIAAATAHAACTTAPRYRRRRHPHRQPRAAPPPGWSAGSTPAPPLSPAWWRRPVQRQLALSWGVMPLQHALCPEHR